MVDVSIIIVSYNTATITLECVRSVQNYMLEHSYEIVVVDNNSKDIEELSQGLMQFENVKLIPNAENIGFAKGNNTGIDQSVGKFIMLLNSDIVVEDNSLDLLVGKCAKLKHPAVMSPRLRSESGAAQLVYGPFPSVLLELIYLLKLHRIFKKMVNKRLPIEFTPDEVFEFNNGFLVAACIIFPRMLLSKLPQQKLHDQMFLYGEEFIWFREFKDIGTKFIYDPSISILHYVGLSSEQGKNFYFNRKYNQMLGERTYLRKFYSKAYRYLFFAIRLVRLRLVGLIDHEMKMRYQVCLKLLKTGV